MVLALILFLAIDQGTAFASRAAQNTMLGIISVAGFCLVYCWFSFRFGWTICILTGWGAFFAFTFILEGTALPLSLSFVGVIAFLALVLILMPKNQMRGITINPPSWDTPLRMLVATAFVLGLTGAAAILGPQLSGLLTPFPMFATVLGVFTHHFQGASSARRLLYGVVAGSFTFAIFFLFISLLVNRWGIAFALLDEPLSSYMINLKRVYVLLTLAGPDGRAAESER